MSLQSHDPQLSRSSARSFSLIFIYSHERAALLKARLFSFVLHCIKVFLFARLESKLLWLASRFV